jgi:hypothetical protein
MELKPFLINQKHPFFPQILDNYISNFFPRKFYHDQYASNLLYRLHILKNSHLQAKYFIVEENEKKENIVIFLDSIKNKRKITALSVFIGYNIVKHLLWTQGYFAYFFYHTKYCSVIIYFIAIELINKNYEAHLIQNNLLRYSEKRKNAKFIENLLVVEAEKKNLLEMKKANNLL